MSICSYHIRRLNVLLVMNCDDYFVSFSQKVALLGLVSKMYFKIQSCGQVSGTNHRDTKETKTDHCYIS